MSSISCADKEEHGIAQECELDDKVGQGWIWERERERARRNGCRATRCFHSVVLSVDAGQYDR